MKGFISKQINAAASATICIQATKTDLKESPEFFLNKSSIESKTNELENKNPYFNLVQTTYNACLTH